MRRRLAAETIEVTFSEGEVDPQRRAESHDPEQIIVQLQVS